LVAPDLDRTIDAAEGQYRTAKDVYERNKKTGVPIISPVIMQASKDAVETTRGTLESLKEQRNYLTMLAPFDGTITTRYLHPGALVIAGGGSEAVPVVRIEDTTRYRLVVFVPEAAVEGVNEGDTITFSTRAMPDRLFEAKVARIAHALDPITRTEPVELDVYNTDQDLIFASGMYIDVLWPFKRPTAGFVVPSTAIVTTTYNQFVIRIKDGVTEWIDVQRGNASDGKVEIFGNLQEGDTVLIRATDELKAGVKVDVQNAPAQ
jgi:RND family efflux transporter MFP subunit